MNDGTVPVNLSDVKLRYWFTNDGSVQNTFTCEYAPCGTENVIGNCYSLDNAVEGADTYCEISFKDAVGKLAPGASTGDIPFRIEGSSDYDHRNDYSCNPEMESNYGDNSKITAYIKGELKYGVEPVTVIDIKLGDIDGSGTVDAIDFALMKKYLLGSLQLDSESSIRQM